MPSGAKKRKAAKKKKGKETNTNPSTNNPQGNDEFKSLDDKGSDGGECGSPASHDHDHDHDNDHDDDHHHHPFSEGNEEMEEGDPSAAQAQPSVFDAKSVEQVHNDVKIEEEAVGRKEDPVVVIEWDVKSEESGEGKDVNVETTVTEKKSGDEPSNSIKEEKVTFDELVKSIDSSHAKIMSMTEEDAQVGKAGNSVLESSVDWGKSGNALLEKSVASPVVATDLAPKKNEDKVYPFSDDTVRTANLYEPEPKDLNNRLPLVSRSTVAESTNGAGHVKDSDAPESSENQPPVVASAPHVVQKTSWLSCCGLFEVLSGSSR